MNEDGIRIEIFRIAPALGRGGGALQTRLFKVGDDGVPKVLNVSYLIKEGYLR